MGKYIDLTASNFEATLADGVSLVDFWAPWCGPCRMIAPIVEELAGDYEGKANVCKVNTDESKILLLNLVSVLFQLFCSSKMVKW